MIKTKVVNFRASVNVPTVQCQNAKENVCTPHLSKYDKIQTNLQEEEQIKYSYD
jgi:hypothetical protein